jgi:hypothetical protein
MNGLRRDLQIFRGPPGWRRLCVTGAYVTIFVVACFSVDAIVVDGVPIGELLIFDCAWLAIATALANTGRGWRWRASDPFPEPSPAAEPAVEDAIEVERRKWRTKFSISA